MWISPFRNKALVSIKTWSREVILCLPRYSNRILYTETSCSLDPNSILVTIALIPSVDEFSEILQVNVWRQNRLRKDSNLIWIGQISSFLQVSHRGINHCSFLLLKPPQNDINPQRKRWFRHHCSPESARFHAHWSRMTISHLRLRSHHKSGDHEGNYLCILPATWAKIHNIAFIFLNAVELSSKKQKLFLLSPLISSFPRQSLPSNHEKLISIGKKRSRISVPGRKTDSSNRIHQISLLRNPS